MMGAQRVRATLLAFALGASAWACANIWGFEPGTEESEGSIEAASAPEQPELDSQVDADATLPADARSDSTPETSDRPSTDSASDADATIDAAVDSAAEARIDSPSDAARDATDSGADSAQAGNEAGCAAVCVPQVPANWGGPYTIYEGTGGPPPPTPPSCPGAYPNAVYDGTATPNAPAANCSCTCGAPTNATCLPPVANYFTDNGCTMPCGQNNQPITTTCTNLDPCSGGLLTFSGPIPSGGTCAPDAGSTVPAAGWTADVRLCGAAAALSNAGCDAGQICAPTAAFPLEAATYCIAQSGSVPCPPGYTAARTYYQSSTDTRACTPCSCGAPMGVTCAASTITVDTAASCSLVGIGVVYGAPQACINTRGASAVVDSLPSPDGGICAPVGGTPTGSFTPTTPTTICCTK